MSPRLIAVLGLLLLSCTLISAGIVLIIRSGEPEMSERLACVTLPAYSSAIQQVMGIIPSWSSLQPTSDGLQTTWAIDAEGATHRLTATLTNNECICATQATSHYPSGSAQAEFAGLLQGAAVAPVSDLDYISSWLEPKLLLNCSAAFLARERYVAAETMPDGTAWRLECTRPAEPAYAGLELSFAVLAPQCQAPPP